MRIRTIHVESRFHTDQYSRKIATVCGKMIVRGNGGTTPFASERYTCDRCQSAIRNGRDHG